MKRWRVVFGFAAVPILGGCMSAGYSTSTLAYSGYSPNDASGYGMTQVSDVRIGIRISTFPELMPIPGYPVYYAPGVSANYFFYDGLYWVFWNSSWYAASWYDGPWVYVSPDAVPLFILRIPVRYYRYPPAYFQGWYPDAPPHWGAYWGPQWEQHRRGWNQWNRAAVPPPAPLPFYQRPYSGKRYPHVEQQRELRNERYGYRPQDPVGRRLYQEREREQPGMHPGMHPGMQPRERLEQRGFTPSPQRPQPGVPERHQQPREYQPSVPMQPQHTPPSHPMAPRREVPGAERAHPIPSPNRSPRPEYRRDAPHGHQPESGPRSQPRNKGAESRSGRGDDRGRDYEDRRHRDRNP